MEFTREDHDRIGRIEASLEGLTTSMHALDRLVVESRASDRRALEIADAANKDARVLAAREMDSRLEKVNEFRGALSDAQATMMPRAEVALLIGNLTVRLEEVATAQTALLGQVIEMRSAGVGRDVGEERTRYVVFAVAGIIFGLVGLAAAIIPFLHR